MLLILKLYGKRLRKLSRLGDRQLENLRWFEHEDCFSLFHCMRGDFSFAGLQPAVCEILKPEPGTVVWGSLFGIAHPPLDMVKVQKPTIIWFLSLKFRIHVHLRKVIKYFVSSYLGVICANRHAVISHICLMNFVYLDLKRWISTA